MKPYLIQPVGIKQYPHVDKPVNYGTEFLASKTGKHEYDANKEHHGEKLTKTTELFYKDEGLYAVFEDEINTKNKGFSTIVNPTKLQDCGDYYEIIEGDIISIDLTNNPRFEETFLYNSNTVIEKNKENKNNGDEPMAEEIKEYERKIGKLQGEVNTLKTTEETLRDDLKTAKEKIKTLEGEKKTAEDSLKVYQDAEKAKAETLATELAGDNEELLETYKKLEIKELETIKKANEEYDKQQEELEGQQNGAKGATGGATGENKYGDKNKNKKFDFKEMSKKAGIKV